MLLTLAAQQTERGNENPFFVGVGFSGWCFDFPNCGILHCASALNFPVGDLKMHFASALDCQLWLQHRLSSCNSSYINLTGDSADLCATEIYYRIALILICCVQGFNQ